MKIFESIYPHFTSAQLSPAVNCATLMLIIDFYRQLPTCPTSTAPSNCNAAFALRTPSFRISPICLPTSLPSLTCPIASSFRSAPSQRSPLRSNLTTLTSGTTITTLMSCSLNALHPKNRRNLPRKRGPGCRMSL